MFWDSFLLEELGNRKTDFHVWEDCARGDWWRGSEGLRGEMKRSSVELLKEGETIRERESRQGSWKLKRAGELRNFGQGRGTQVLMHCDYHP